MLQTLKKIGTWFVTLFKKSVDYFEIGKNIANTIKAFADSKLLDVVVSLTPTDLDDKLLPKFRELMADFVKGMGFADIVLNQVKDPKVYASITHTLSAGAASIVSDLTNGTVNIQQSLTAAQFVYKPENVIKE